MPKKRKSTESENDGQTTGALSQEEDNSKRGRLDLLSDTTLQDLPLEILEYILFKAVALEVKDLKLAKAVWSDKADLAIDRLRTVSPQWSNLLTTNFFRNELHRILDGTGQKFHFEILYSSTITFEVGALTSLGDDIFLLYEYTANRYKENYLINVYNRNNMEEVKQVIPLPGKDPRAMIGCNVFNCVYVSLDQRNPDSLSILRITKDEEHDQYGISPWESDHRRSVTILSVTANGSLMILDGYIRAISIYNANGSLQHEVMFSSDLDVCDYVHQGLLQKSNGNMVLAYVSDVNYLTKLLEIDMSGSVVRQFESAYNEESYVTFADSHDRIMISSPSEEFELVDAEFNLLGVFSLQQDVGKDVWLFDWHFDRERNEIVRIHYDRIQMTNHLTKYRLTEE